MEYIYMGEKSGIDYVRILFLTKRRTEREREREGVIYNFCMEGERDIETWQKLQGYEESFDRHFYLLYLSTNENGHRPEDERSVGTARENCQRAERVDEEERGSVEKGDKKGRRDYSTNYKGIIDHA